MLVLYFIWNGKDCKETLFRYHVSFKGGRLVISIPARWRWPVLHPASYWSRHALPAAASSATCRAVQAKQACRKLPLLKRCTDSSSGHHRGAGPVPAAANAAASSPDLDLVFSTLPVPPPLPKILPLFPGQLCCFSECYHPETISR